MEILMMPALSECELAGAIMVIINQYGCTSVYMLRERLALLGFHVSEDRISEVARHLVIDGRLKYVNGKGYCPP